MINRFLLFIFTASIIGCKPNLQQRVSYQPFVDSTKENLWGGDVRLSITNYVKSDSITAYTLKSVYNNDTLGIQINIPNKISKKGFGEGMEIVSLGEISKKFKNELASIYKIKVDTSERFVTQINVSFADLKQFMLNSTGDLPTNHIGFKDYKLFFEDSNNTDEGEAEIFVNVNEKEKVVDIREKDKEYRKSIIGFLTQKK